MDPRRPLLAALHAALLDAFRTRSDLARLVGLGLGEHLDTIAGGENDAAVVFNLVEWADSHGRIEELAGAALAANPANPKLRAAVAALGLPVPPLTPGQRIRNPLLRPWLLGIGALLTLGLLALGGQFYRQTASGLRIDTIRYYPAESTLDVQVRNLDATDGVINRLTVTILDRTAFPPPAAAATPGPTLPPIRDAVTATPGLHIDFDLLPSAIYTATLTEAAVGQSILAQPPAFFAVAPHSADRFLLALGPTDDLRVTLTALYNGTQPIVCTFRLSQADAVVCK